MYKIIYLPTAEYAIIDSASYMVNLRMCPRSWFENLILYQKCVYFGVEKDKVWFPGGLADMLSIKQADFNVPKYLLEIIEVPDV